MTFLKTFKIWRLILFPLAIFPLHARGEAKPQPRFSDEFHQSTSVSSYCGHKGAENSGNSISPISSLSRDLVTVGTKAELIPRYNLIGMGELLDKELKPDEKKISSILLEKDKKLDAKYLDDIEREKYRVTFSNGKISYTDGSLLGSSGSSKDKEWINTENSILAHSSFIHVFLQVAL